MLVAWTTCCDFALITLRLFLAATSSSLFLRQLTEFCAKIVNTVPIYHNKTSTSSVVWIDTKMTLHTTPPTPLTNTQCYEEKQSKPQLSKFQLCWTQLKLLVVVVVVFFVVDFVATYLYSLVKIESQLIVESLSVVLLSHQSCLPIIPILYTLQNM